jgi:hypothetical protein
MRLAHENVQIRGADSRTHQYLDGTLSTTEAAELRTALSVFLLASLDELLHARQLLLALPYLLTGLALPRLTLRVGRVHLLLEFLHLLLHLREEVGITLRPSRNRDGERNP